MEGEKAEKPLLLFGNENNNQKRKQFVEFVRMNAGSNFKTETLFLFFCGYH